MSLIELCNNNLTDKNTLHSYLELYEELFNRKKYSAKNILEVGIGPYRESNGGSIKLWSDYFINATVYGLDIIPIDGVNPFLINYPRVILHTKCNAYNADFFIDTFLNCNIKFDMVIDDGPHTLDSMLQFIRLYSSVLTDDGILVIEDVQNIEWIRHLKNITPGHLKSYIEVYDRREVKGRYDDIVFVINKKPAKL